MRTKGKIYISGQVVGASEADINKKFFQAERMLAKYGFEVVNPITLIKSWPEDIRWQQGLQICLNALKECTAIYMLPCSDKSDVSKVELDQAIRDNAFIYYELENVEAHEFAENVHG